MPDICCQAVLFQVGQMSGQCFIQFTIEDMDRIILSLMAKWCFMRSWAAHCAKIRLDKLEIWSMCHLAMSVFLQFAASVFFKLSICLLIQLFRFSFLSPSSPVRRCQTLPMFPASAMGYQAHAALRPVGYSWLTSARLGMHWRRSTTAQQPWSSTPVESWCRCTASSTLPRATTWCTSNPVQTTAWRTRAQAPWAQWGAFATRPRRAWMDVSWCAAAVVMTSSRPR